jgi:hypothetical protein
VKISASKYIHASLAMVLCSFWWNACATELSAEERLQAIRSSMIEAAMKSDTHVTSTSWMETNGALREMNRFSSEIKLRDLQVKEYVRDIDLQPKANLVAVSQERVGASSSCQAPLAKAPLLQLMNVGLSVSEDIPPKQKYVAQKISVLAKDAIFQFTNQSARWHLTTAAAQKSSYNRNLLGHGEEHIAWHLQISVDPAPLGYTTDDVAGYVLRWSIQSTMNGSDWYLNKQALAFMSNSNGALNIPKVDKELVDEIYKSALEVTTEVDKKLACDPQGFAFVKNSPGKITINAGQQAGLHVGDKLMLTDSGLLPKHALEADALESAVLAEVKSVSAYQAELRQVAGRKQKFQGAWIAWPYTY